MKKGWNARRGIPPDSVRCSRLRRLAWRRPRASDGRNRYHNGYIRPHPPPFRAVWLRFTRLWSFGDRRVRRRFDIDPCLGRIPFLANGRRRPSYLANDGARQSRLRSIDASGCLHDHAGRLVLACTAAPNPCNVAASTAIATVWRRSVLAKINASFARSRRKPITGTLPPAFYSLKRIWSSSRERSARICTNYCALQQRLFSAQSESEANARSPVEIIKLQRRRGKSYTTSPASGCSSMPSGKLKYVSIFQFRHCDREMPGDTVGWHAPRFMLSCPPDSAVRESGAALSASKIHNLSVLANEGDGGQNPSAQGGSPGQIGVMEGKLPDQRAMLTYYVETRPGKTHVPCARSRA